MKWPRVGDLVEERFAHWHVHRAPKKGIVVDVREGDPFPVCVRWDGDDTQTYLLRVSELESCSTEGQPK